MKIGLALSGGGVLGVAHIGLLEQLEKRQIRASLVAGTSAGAILGSLYAKGGVVLIDLFLERLKNDGLFSRSSVIKYPTPDKIFEKVRQTLGEFLNAQDFKDLPVKFFCNATAIENGENEIFYRGELLPRIMASAAYPGVFGVQKIDDHYYFDGGISRNLLARVLADKGAGFIIGSNLYNIKKYENYSTNNGLRSRAEIAVRALDIMQKELAATELDQCDFVFDPPVDAFRWYNFDRIEEIRQIGRECAKESIEQLVKAIKVKDIKGFWKNLF